MPVTAYSLCTSDPGCLYLNVEGIPLEWPQILPGLCDFQKTFLSGVINLGATKAHIKSNVEYSNGVGRGSLAG